MITKHKYYTQHLSVSRYRWAFVGAAETSEPNSLNSEDEKPHSPDFVPHVMRIARLMDHKVCFHFN